jgi:hypothetical protein
MRRALWDHKPGLGTTPSTKGGSMDNKHCYCSFRITRKKMKWFLTVLETILKLVILLLQIWTLIMG